MSLIYTNEGQIRELTQKTNKLTTIFSSTIAKITGLDANYDPKFIYFSLEQPPSIHQIEIETKKRNFLLDKDIVQPQKLAVDWSTQNIYYYNAQSNDKFIGICSYKDTACAKVINIDLHRQVSAMAVDSVNKKLYYALSNWWMFNSPTYMIFSTNLDGTGSEVLVEASSGKFTAITPFGKL